MLEYTIRHEGPESVAAFILEPISNTGGIVVPPQEYFQEVREICSRYGVLLIYDEIITGMGRTGNWFAAQTFGVAPDILCAGKGLASGYAPLAAMIARDELHYSAFWGEESQNISFAHGHTFGGNPIATAAGLAVIEVIEKEALIPKGALVGEHIRKRLREEIGALGILGEVRGRGSAQLRGIRRGHGDRQALCRPTALRQAGGEAIDRARIDPALRSALDRTGPPADHDGGTGRRNDRGVRQGGRRGVARGELSGWSRRRSSL